MKQPASKERNLADYGYPTSDVAGLSAKALEVTRRLTEKYGELPFSSKDPMSDTPLRLKPSGFCHSSVVVCRRHGA